MHYQAPYSFTSLSLLDSYFIISSQLMTSLYVSFENIANMDCHAQLLVVLGPWNLLVFDMTWINDALLPSYF
jgi:hypothetical protein